MGQVTIKATVQKPRKDGRFILYFRVQKDKRIAYMKTDKVVSAEGLTKEKEPKEPYMRRWCADRIDEFYERLNRVEVSGWDVKQVVAFLTDNGEGLSFSAFMVEFIDEMVNSGRGRTAKDYRAAVKSLREYSGIEDMLFSYMTPSFLEGWIKSLMGTKRAKERYPICIRYAYQQAQARYNDEDAGVIRIPGNPWRNIQIPRSDTPEKRAAEPEVLREFFACELPESKFVWPVGQLGQDVAKMMFCLAGINTIDLYQLKKVDYYDGVIHYYRQKVTVRREDRGYFEMRVPGLVRPLFEKYRAGDDDEYLLNFHARCATPDSFNADVNKGIKQVCEVAGLEPMDGYTFRHSWATILQNECGASLGDVDFGLNHSSGHRLAKVYTKINYEPAWVMNEKVIEFLFFTDKLGSRSQRDKDNGIDKISTRNMMKAEAFYMGRKVGQIQDIGFRNVGQVIDAVMAVVPEEYKGKTLQLKVENMDKRTSQMYERRK